jgi:hypothetical protein
MGEAAGSEIIGRKQKARDEVKWRENCASVRVKKNLGPDLCVKYCKNTTILTKP